MAPECSSSWYQGSPADSLAAASFTAAASLSPGSAGEGWAGSDGVPLPAATGAGWSGETGSLWGLKASSPTNETADATTARNSEAELIDHLPSQLGSNG